MIFLGLYSPQSEEYQKANRAVIQINKKIIRDFEFQSVYEGLKQQKELQLSTNFRLTSSMERQLREQAMQQLVIAEVLKQNATQRGCRIHPKDLAITLRKIPAFQVEQKFSFAKFEEMLSQIGYNRTAFLSALIEEEAIAQIRSGIIDSAFVVPMEVNTAIRLVKQKRDFDYVQVPASHFIKQAKVSHQEMQDYYEQHLTEFRSTEQVSVDYSILSLSDIATDLKRQYPQWDKKHLEEQAQQKFTKALAVLQKHHSTHPNDLVGISQALQKPIQSTDLFSRTNGQSEITKHPKVIAAVFSPQILKNHNIAIIFLNADCVVALQLKQHKPVQLISFQNVQPKIQQYLRLKKAQLMAQQSGEKWVKQLKQNTADSFDGGAAHFHWKTIKQATRYDKKIPSVILNAAFKMPYTQNSINIMGFVLPNGNYVIIRLNKVLYGLVKQFKGPQYHLYQEELAAEAGQFEYNLYVRQNVQRAKINYLSIP